MKAQKFPKLFLANEFSSIMINNRVDLKLSLRPCAKIIGISSATLNRIENLKYIPDLITYYKCCIWLNYPLDYFFNQKVVELIDWEYELITNNEYLKK